MQTRVPLFAAALALLLSGCVAVPQEMRIQTQKDCRPAARCDVPVDAFTGLVPEHVLMPSNVSSTLHWQIPQWSMWRFDTPAIVFGANASGVITCNPNPAGNERTVVCQNTGTPNEAGYKYTVRLKMLAMPVAYDPFV